ncbi:hypothetical protein SF12_22095 [Streptomyces sp. MBRL 601]|nr:hypothetical protein SF12_22095 [Streptomyces sp. MBRL 601]
MMTVRPHPAQTLARLDRLLVATERNVADQRAAYEAAKAEWRRMRRLRAVARCRGFTGLVRRGRPVLGAAFVLCGVLTLLAGSALLALDEPGGPELLGVSAAAWSLAAALSGSR